jgi:hypothetical protein
MPEITANEYDAAATHLQLSAAPTISPRGSDDRERQEMQQRFQYLATRGTPPRVITRHDAAYVADALASLSPRGRGEGLEDAAAQGEIERLREALREFLNAGGVQWMSGMTTSSAWSLPKLAAASVKAHSALTLKSEKAASSLKGSDVGEVGE